LQYAVIFALVVFGLMALERVVSTVK